MPYRIIVQNNPVNLVDPTGLSWQHVDGVTIQCGKCTIRIDFTFNDQTGERRNHLHWNCKGKEGLVAKMARNLMVVHGTMLLKMSMIVRDKLVFEVTLRSRVQQIPQKSRFRRTGLLYC